jgi:dipeptidyl aminopeptidase/acylaminoacyl peptidase
MVTRISPACRTLVCALVAIAAGCGSQPSPTAPSTPSTPSAAGRFEVSVPGAGIQLGGILLRPEISGGNKPGIVVLHGWQTAGTNGAATVEPRARRYVEDGYVALALSMRGWPPSGGADDCGLRQPDDIAAAVRWLADQPGVDGQRIGIVGFSQGGQVALLAGARGGMVRAIVAYFPVTDVALWKQTTTNVDIPSYITAVCEAGGAGPRSPRSQAATIGAPVLLVHGDADTRVPTEQSRLMRSALETAGRPVELFLVPGAEHGFNANQEALSRPVVDRFLAEWLK